MLTQAPGGAACQDYGDGMCYLERAERPLVLDADTTLHSTGELHAFFDHFARDSRHDRAVGLLEQIVVEHVNDFE